MFITVTMLGAPGVQVPTGCAEYPREYVWSRFRADPSTCIKGVGLKYRDIRSDSNIPNSTIVRDPWLVF